MLKKSRKYYRIGQVSEILGVEPHILRFWEKQFKEIQPRRISKQRLYRSQDLKLLKRIKELLYQEGYTISGAQKRLKEELSKEKKKTTSEKGCNQCKVIEDIKKELIEIKRLLSEKLD